MIVAFDDSLSTQRIFAERQENEILFGRTTDSFETDVLVASLCDPVLVTDSHRILNLDEPMRESVIALLTSQWRTARFGRTTHTVDKALYPFVWAPSIDTFFLCSVLQSTGFDSVSNVVEIGCGSGFIGKYLLELVPEDVTVHMVDNDADAIGCAREAVASTRAEFHLAAAQDYLAANRVALVVSNPPYLTSPEGNDIPPFGGLSLMKFLVSNAINFLLPGGRLILLQSSLTIEFRII